MSTVKSQCIWEAYKILTKHSFENMQRIRILGLYLLTVCPMVTAGMNSSTAQALYMACTIYCWGDILNTVQMSGNADSCSCVGMDLMWLYFCTFQAFTMIAKHLLICQWNLIPMSFRWCYILCSHVDLVPHVCCIRPYRQPSIIWATLRIWRNWINFCQIILMMLGLISPNGLQRISTQVQRF